jgi:hypothetical protein
MKPLGKALTLGIALFGCTLVGTSALIGKDKQIIPVAAVAQADLDQAIAWMQEGKRNYTAVKDYTCMLVSQENVNGKLLDANYIQLKMKAEPFSVHMRWAAPEKSKGQEVAFVLGKNNNKMRVNSKLLGGGLWLSIDPNDKRVTQHSRHNILEAGIGNMIEQTLVQWDKDRKLGKTAVKTAVFLCNGKSCHKVELTRLAKDPAFYCHRTVIYLEKESKLPIRLDNYDWPREGGPAGGELLESFSYVNLEFNVGLKDADFNK